MLLAGLIALIRIGRAAKRPHHRLPSRWRASSEGVGLIYSTAADHLI